MRSHSTIEIIIFGHTHRLTCQAGQEERLKQLAEKFQKQAEATAKSLGTMDFRLIYLISALTLLDELYLDPGLGHKDDGWHPKEVEQLLEAVSTKVREIREQLV